MQVDQFESEVESLSVQTRKKKGDKDVSGGPRAQGVGAGARSAEGGGRATLVGGSQGLGSGGRCGRSVNGEGEGCGEG